MADNDKINAVGLKRLPIGSDIEHITAAMNEAECFIKNLNLDDKTALRVRLLTEEVLEMLKTMVGEFTGSFRVEVVNGEFRIHIDGTAEIDLDKEEELLSVSKTGENISVKGFTAKISQFIKHHKEYLNNLFDAMGENPSIDYMHLGPMDGYISQTALMWSMSEYKDYLESGKLAAEYAEEDLDELEKSIVASLADDVQVGVKDDDITITVIKKI